MLTKKQLVGVTTSGVLFGMFGLFIGNIIIAFAGVAYTAPFSDLATGTTTVPMMDAFRPLGLEPEVVGLSNDATFILPAIPASLTAGNIVIDLAEFTVAQVFGFGGAAFGTLVGFYYAIRIAYEQRQETGQPNSTADEN